MKLPGGAGYWKLVWFTNIFSPIILDSNELAGANCAVTSSGGGALTHLLSWQELKIQPSLNSQLVPVHMQGAEGTEAAAVPAPEADKQVSCVVEASITRH